MLNKLIKFVTDQKTLYLKEVDFGKNLFAAQCRYKFY